VDSCIHCHYIIQVLSTTKIFREIFIDIIGDRPKEKQLSGCQKATERKKKVPSRAKVAIDFQLFTLLIPYDTFDRRNIQY
jgi:hypothetical protein